MTTRGTAANTFSADSVDIQPALAEGSSSGSGQPGHANREKADPSIRSVVVFGGGELRQAINVVDYHKESCRSYS
jgi:hypothetical protein